MGSKFSQVNFIVWMPLKNNRRGWIIWKVFKMKDFVSYFIKAKFRCHLKTKTLKISHCLIQCESQIGPYNFFKVTN